MTTSASLRPDTALAELRRHWVALSALIVGVAFGVSSLCFYTFGAFIGPLIAAKHWNRAGISAALLTALVMPLASPVLGRLVDAGRARLLVLTGHAVLVLGFLAMTQIGGDVRQLWLLYGALFLLAGGSSPIGYTRLLVSRFRVARGLALGLCMAGTGIAALFGPRVVTSAILAHGWQAGYVVLAVAAASAIPIVALLVSAEPVARPAGLAVAATAARLSASERRLLRFLLALFLLAALAVTGLVVHLIPFLRDRGMSPLDAATVAGVIGLAVIATRVLIGAALDRYPMHLVTSGTFLLTGAGVLMPAVLGSSAAWIGALAIGLLLGAEIDVIAFVMARLFAETAYGHCYSRGYSAFIVGSALSPMLAGAVRDATGSYTPFFLGSAVTLFACAAAALRIPRERETPVLAPSLTAEAA